MNNKAQVLIVDDDKDLLGVLSMAVEKMGHLVHAVEDAVEARKWMTHHSPKLIVLDIMMPDGSGLEFCRWVRGQPRFHIVPILVMSAMKDEEIIEDAMELGVADFIHKPVSAQILKDKISRILAPPPPIR